MVKTPRHKTRRKSDDDSSDGVSQVSWEGLRQDVAIIVRKGHRHGSIRTYGLLHQNKITGGKKDVQR